MLDVYAVPRAAFNDLSSQETDKSNTRRFVDRIDLIVVYIYIYIYCESHCVVSCMSTPRRYHSLTVLQLLNPASVQSY